LIYINYEKKIVREYGLLSLSDQEAGRLLTL
jgi:hypothetical protein